MTGRVKCHLTILVAHRNYASFRRANAVTAPYDADPERSHMTPSSASSASLGSLGSSASPLTHGRHIKVLGRASAALLADALNIEGTLRELVAMLGMRLLGAPHMYEVEAEIEKLGVEPFEDEGGVTGVCVLSTSHCSIHTWPLRPFFVMDVYSCRDFDPKTVEAHLARRLGAYHLQVTDVSVSLEYHFENAPLRDSKPPHAVRASDAVSPIAVSPSAVSPASPTSPSVVATRVGQARA